MKKLFKFKYPKLTILVSLIVFAYAIFKNPLVGSFFQNLGDLSYLGIFIGGLLFSFGFTTPFAIGIFLTSSPSNILIASLLGGFGAMLSDLFIYKIIKITFMDEFNKLKKTPYFKEIEKETNAIPRRIKHYLLYAFAGIIIASPLPDEIGVSMLAGLSHVKLISLGIISFIFNTLGVFILLSI